MPSSRRRDLIPRRRRQEDDGEEEGSLIDDIDDDSLSEGSAISNEEDEREIAASEASGEQEQTLDIHTISKSSKSELPPDKQRHASPGALDNSTKPFFRNTVDTEAMLNGIKPSPTGDEEPELDFDKPTGGAEKEPTTEENVLVVAQNETPAQRNRREHQEYIQQRNANPAFVPNRGGFFLHDDRSSANPAHNPRNFVRGKGRPPNQPFYPGRAQLPSEPVDKQWAHDLHDKHENQPAVQSIPKKSIVSEVPTQPSAVPTSTAPNRTFSFSTVLGNVNVQVSVPGSTQKKTVANVVRKQHTLLPQHRPPLRRDKPVRISIPDQPPRYIFPSTERSFIFIPRALRPNQQAYGRGRGRGSFHGSRRPSIFGASTYTPSVAMSRKSSIGGVNRDGVKSPVEATLTRSIAAAIDPARPIVRLPTIGAPIPVQAIPVDQIYATRPMDRTQLVNGTVSHGIQPTAIPLYQPRPQKTVSLAGIESPASFVFKPPQQQQEQPFHQQMPAHIGGDEHTTQLRQSAHGSITGETPLSHIPETAIYAHPFQPYPMMQQPLFYGAVPYGSGAGYYTTTADGMAYAAPVPGIIMAPNFVPGSQSHPLPHQGMANIPTMAHETNGMVYYYDPSQYSGDGQMVANQYSAGATMPVMMGQPQYYHPTMQNAMFYPAQPG